MVTSSSDYSSSSSDEDSRIHVAKARASMDHAKNIINSMPLDELKASRDELLNRKAREEIIANYREKRRRVQRKMLESEERLRSRPDGVKADLQAECDEEDYWNVINGDLIEDEFSSSDSDSEKEFEGESLDDDDDDDESDDSDD
ncbi:nucleolar transcription factor 1-like [Papaver somniferum]|uniref:nucleolar transcription factor 1-like n=1 Tax=Papaver somniferum TaxID=3469 RepID=UPI000E6F4F9C|nr:nucleolar transcription factor 1-like [Papaver somniferum]